MKSTILYPVPETSNTLTTNSMTRGQCDCNCDCACASAQEYSYKRVPTSALWRKADNLVELPITPAHQILLFPLRDGRAVLNSRAYGVLNSFMSPRSLEPALMGVDDAHTEHQLAALGLVMPVGQDYACTSTGVGCIFSGEVISPLVAWLHLTDRCNLRCSYCYLPHVREDMSPEAGHAAVDAIFRSAISNGFRQVKLKYAGGEPLLRYPLILDLHVFARSLAEKQGLILEEVILSNGTLLSREIVSTLKALGIQLMISMDGYGAYHDSQRSYIGGRGSFNDVSEAIELALATDLVPTISVTVSSRTAEGLPEILAWILERDLPFGLNFYRENEFSSSREDMRLENQKIIRGMLAAFEVIESNLPRRSFIGGIVDRANLSAAHTHTCGVGHNYLVFDQHGQVAKCQMQLHKPVTHSYVPDPLAVIRTDHVGIQNVSVDEKEGCRSCEWKYWCAGGCPLETHRATGRYDVKSPNCNIYKALYPEALRLEGLRLLKYQDDPGVVIRC